MCESFENLFKKNLSKEKLYPGSIVSGTVIEINDKSVIVDVGLKSEGFISKNQFYNKDNSIEVKVGDNVDLVIEALENGFGETQLSREKAKKLQSWMQLEKFYENNETVTGLVINRVKGGFTVEVEGVKAFLPGSLVDIKPIRNPEEIENKEFEFKIIKMDQKRNNIVISRKSILEGSNTAERLALLNSLSEGQVLNGIIKNLTDYGAFVDLGGVDGLLHITDMSWRRIKHPSEIVSIAEEIKVKILKFDKEKNRVSLGLKQLESDPWINITKKYPESFKSQGKITKITDYGCFVELEEGIEGLVHVSEMDWTNKNINPNKVVQLDMIIDVLVLNIDENRRRISLGIKQCIKNPWNIFAENNRKGDRITGIIKSITDFGVFVGLDGNIDGLVHLSDISWEINDSTLTNLMSNYKKGSKIETSILSIDADRERISLGVKQLMQSPFIEYISNNSKGDIVNATIKEIAPKTSIIQLTHNVEGYLRTSELNENEVEEAKNNLKNKEKIKVKIVNIDQKTNTIMVSIRAKNIQDKNELLKKLNRYSEKSSAQTFGDLFKDKISGNIFKKRK